MIKISLTGDISQLKGVGPSKAEKLSILGVSSPLDILLHFPTRYSDTSETIPVDQINTIEKLAYVKATIRSRKNTYTRNRMVITKATIYDESGEHELTWFNQPYLLNTLTVNSEYIFNIRRSQKSGKLYCQSVEKFSSISNESKLIPTYPQTSGITSKALKSLVKLTLDSIPPDVFYEYDIGEVSKEYDISLHEAIKEVHFPTDSETLERATKRLQLDEILSLQIEIEKKRLLNSSSDAVQITQNKSLLEGFMKSLPFELTDDQKTAIETMSKEMASNQPMHRLLNGDVGSGKTVVAMALAQQVINAGLSVIFLAPTTILAKQHRDSFEELTDLPVTLLTSAERKYQLPNETQVIIGTHALLFRSDLPSNIGLVIVDEQHRFGVNQREHIRNGVNKGLQPHYISMTATPIPRTLTNVLFGDMDVSFINTPPAHRKSIETHLVPESKRADCYRWIRERIHTHNDQVYYIYPLIEESMGGSEKKNVTDGYYTLSDTVFSDITTGLLHGKMKEKDKNMIMSAFKDGDIKILFSTTVIEVGVDVSNASIILIEDAENFGLAQLHQLRGRVGRGSKQSYAFLFSKNSYDERLQYFSEQTSGFDIAEFDLKSRGPGEVFGTAQSGIPDMRIADITDLATIRKAKSVVQSIDISTATNLFTLLRNKES